MSFNIIDAPSENKGESRAASSITNLVVHATAGDFKSSYDWLRKKGSGVSAHYLINLDGALYRLVHPKFVAWHAGVSSWRGRDSVNKFSIGVELVNVREQPYTDRQYRVLAQLYVLLAKHYPIPLEGIVGHYHVSPGRKTDPYYVFEWGKLFQYIEQEKSK